MSDQKLKPCPFCGGEARRRGDEYSEAVICDICRASSGWQGNFDNARRIWNTRTPDPRLEELAGALEKSCNSVCELIGFSRGVDGLHLNGDVATWEDLRTGGEFECWLIEFDDALQVLREYKAKVQP